MSKEKKKPVLDLVTCYSGLKLDELEYIDFTNTEVGNASAEVSLALIDLEPEQSGCNGIHRIQEEDVDGVMSECGDFQEYANTTGEVDRSYLCSTPTEGRKHRGYFSQDSDISGFALDCTAKQLRKSDSGIRTRSVSRSSMSYFREGDAVDGSTEDLNSTSSTNSPDLRRKIGVDSDIHDPYSVDDDMLSIEEISHSSEGSTTTLGTIKRRLSQKLLRNTSFGLFDSYRRQRQSEGSTQSPSLDQLQLAFSGSNDDQVPMLNHQNGHGPMNYWFRKFRNRHYL